MIVIDYDPHCKDKPLDSELVPNFVDFSRIEHRQLPLTERPNQLTDRVYISTIKLLRQRVESLNRCVLSPPSCGNRQ